MSAQPLPLPVMTEEDIAKRNFFKLPKPKMAKVQLRKISVPLLKAEPKYPEMIGVMNKPG